MFLLELYSIYCLQQDCLYRLELAKYQYGIFNAARWYLEEKGRRLVVIAVEV